MPFVVLDTDVASLAFRRRLPRPLAARLAGHTWCVTFVTVGEMTQWARIPKDYDDLTEEHGLRLVTG